MPNKRDRNELKRLKALFEEEANRFQDITMSIRYLTQKMPSKEEVFRRPNHVIMLWQYYGKLGDTEEDLQQMAIDVISSDQKWGVRGSKFSAFAVIEGQAAPLFMRMVNRAGNALSDAESLRIRMKAGADFKSNLPTEKSVFTSNQDAGAVWINKILHNMNKTHPGYGDFRVELGIDPFVASLRLTEQLILPPSKRNKRKMGKSDFEKTRFKVALTFPGTQRSYVEEIADVLKKKYGNELFYDMYFQHHLARPNLDLLLQDIYHNRSDLIVVFMCEDYSSSEWCGLEWRAIRDLIKKRADRDIMLFKFDNTRIDGIFEIDGYVDLRERTPTEAAKLIVARLESR